MRSKQRKPNARVLKTRAAAVAPAVPVLSGDPPRDAGPFRSGRLLDRLSSAERKLYPIAEGVMDYFPDALAMVANISYRGNQKHNPGEPLHHSRGKSMDHADCIMRHLQERGCVDPEGVLHSAQLAWRALALCQEELEKVFGLPLPRNARFDLPPGPGAPTKT